jgi:hypothetical protein
MNTTMDENDLSKRLFRFAIDRIRRKEKGLRRKYSLIGGLYLKL